MQVCLHIGTEKTASSYLQSISALGREALQESGVAFPRGWWHDEESMAAGRISAGNARRLAQALDRGDLGAVQENVRSALHEAGRSGADAILLSSEWLLSALAEKGRLQALEDAFRSAGVTSTRYLLVLRDPVGQCLSLYKHRAKRGTAGDIEQWCASGYRLPHDLAGFRGQADALGIDLTVQTYRREQGALERQFFQDWLSVPVPDVQVPTTVNPSLTLSELTLIRKMASSRPMLVPSLYDALMSVDASTKVQGEALQRYARAVAERTVAAHADEWTAWNARLPADGQLDVPAARTAPPERPTESGFSDVQVEALARFMSHAATPEFIASSVWRHHVRPWLGRAGRAIGIRRR